MTLNNMAKHLNKKGLSLSNMSLAYYQSAMILAEEIKDEDIYNHRYMSRVPLFLIHHSLELLFKSGIYISSGDLITNSHVLKDLKEKFDTELPDLAFSVPKVIMGESALPPPLFPDLEVVRDPQDMRLRYPLDKYGNYWNFDFKLDINDVFEELNDLSHPINLTWLKLSELAVVDV